MAQPSQGDYPAAPESCPVKRKRGRPRKDESVRSRHATDDQASQVQPVFSSGTSLVGQQVSGVISGKFDAGYLLSVKVGSTGPILQGLVFQPSMYSQVTKENDIAPFIPMSGGHETPPMVQRINRASVKASSNVVGNSGKSIKRSPKIERPKVQTISSGFTQSGVPNDVPSSEPVKTSSETLPGQESSNSGHKESTKDATTHSQLRAAGSSTYHTTTNTENTTLTGSGDAASVAVQAPVTENSGQVGSTENSRAASVLNNIDSAIDPAPDAAAVPAPENDEMVVQLNMDPQSCNDNSLPADNAK